MASSKRGSGPTGGPSPVSRSISLVPNHPLAYLSGPLLQINTKLAAAPPLSYPASVLIWEAEPHPLYIDAIEVSHLLQNSTSVAIPLVLA